MSTMSTTWNLRKGRFVVDIGWIGERHVHHEERHVHHLWRAV
jgi:hypothetical protein